MSLPALLTALGLVLSDTEVVFCTLPGVSLKHVLHLEPVASFAEAEGLSLVSRRCGASAQAGGAAS